MCKHAFARSINCDGDLVGGDEMAVMVSVAAAGSTARIGTAA
jgi:hypothetical protein